MSRQIDISDPSQLSEEDLQYLRDRDRSDVMAQLLRYDADKAMETHPEANARLEEENARLKDVALTVAQRQYERREIPKVNETHLVDDVPPYEEWTVTELKDELKARELPVSGTKEELVARLYDNDGEPSDS